MKHSFRTWFLGITTIFALLALAASTYAWFSSNRAVSTNVATARTGDETLELQLSRYGGGSFQSEETVPIQQVNQTDAENLLPVSTSDLSDFVYAPVTNADMASQFSLVQNEAYYYHGRIYLRAVGDGWPDGSRLNLYLDQSDGVLGQNVDGRLLSAARLGLVFDGDSQSAVILRLSEEEGSENQRVYNTVVNGQTLGNNQVLSYRNGTVQAVADPSVPVAEYTISFGDNEINLPDQNLLSMEFNRIYPLDIYFYLEGCDPDCSNELSYDAADLHLAFYGVLSQ